MNFDDIAKKVKGVLGGDLKDTAEKLGLNTIIDSIGDLIGKVDDDDDKKSITDIVSALKKAVADKVDLGAIAKKCLSIAGSIKTDGIKDAVEALLKKLS